MIKKSLLVLKRILSRPRGIEIDSVYPVSNFFGDDRGTPIDRYYIEKFLEEHQDLIRGDLLEVAENKYSRRFGRKEVSRTDVLHYEKGAPHATIIGDLTKPATLPINTFDCFICTQTFHVIYDFRQAIHGAFQLLKPGGTLLATVSGLAQISEYDMDRWGDFWRFTPLSAKRAFSEVFKAENVSVDYFGNCYAATNFLRGISLEEVSREKLDIKDRNYPIIVTIIATKDR